mgnify:CR=1 FL=1|jgi:hypothetical protein
MFRKKTYMDWDTYMDRVDFLDIFYWQQSVRNTNISR